MQKQRQKLRQKNEAESTIYQTEKTLSEHKDKVPQEDQDTIQASIVALKEAVSDDSTSSDALKEKLEAVKQASMKIGEAMYRQSSAEGTDAGGGAQSADYEDVSKDKDKGKEEK